MIEFTNTRVVALLCLGVLAAAASVVAATVGGLGVAAFYLMAVLCVPLAATALITATAVQRSRAAADLGEELLAEQQVLRQQALSTETALATVQRIVTTLAAAQQAASEQASVKRRI